jgi:hypothetical protein
MGKETQLVTWYKPDEKHPPEGWIVLATVSGHRHDRHITYDHAFALVEWFDDGEGWYLTHDYLDEFTIHAWCNVSPYNLDEVQERVKE